MVTIWLLLGVDDETGAGAGMVIRMRRRRGTKEVQCECTLTGGSRGVNGHRRIGDHRTENREAFRYGCFVFDRLLLSFMS